MEPIFTSETTSMKHLFEKPLRDLLRTRLQKLCSDDVFIDVGACVGTSCLLIENGKCFAFEADPDAIRELTKNTSLNPDKKVVVVEKAVSNRVFNYAINKKNRLGDSYLTAVNDASAPETVTLDEYFKGFKNIKIIKVDAEGQDYNVLLGGERIIKNNRPLVIVEAWNKEIERKISGFLRKLGYTISYVGLNVVAEHFPSKRSLEVTTMSKCIVDCVPCPQSVFQEAFGEKPNLSLTNFKLALSNVSKDVVIEFAGFSEPFLNPECIDMILYADKEGYRIIVDTTLTGLTPQDINKISDCDLMKFSLHLPDNKGNTKIPYNTQNYKDTLIACLTKINVTSFVSMNDSFVSNERAGNCVDAPYPYRNLMGNIDCGLGRLKNPHPVLLPDGRVVICCMDYGLIHILGNLLHDSYDEVTSAAVFYPGNLCKRCKFAVLKRDKTSLLVSFFKKIVGRLGQ